MPPVWTRSARYIALTTFRRSGVPVTTPVWFAARDDRLLVWTAAESGKAKRLRTRPEVTVVPCTMRGTPVGSAVDGTAVLLPASELPGVRSALRAKYGLVLAAYDAAVALWLRVRHKPEPPSVAIEITIRDTACGST
jgi:PPOX class probable F420-dependent enzyme